MRVHVMNKCVVGRGERKGKNEASDIGPGFESPFMPHGLFSLKHKRVAVWLTVM